MTSLGLYILIFAASAFGPDPTRSQHEDTILSAESDSTSDRHQQPDPTSQLSGGNYTAAYQLEQRTLSTNTWPHITFVLSPRGELLSRAWLPPDEDTFFVREGDDPTLYRPEHVTSYRSNGDPTSFVLVVDANAGTRPYFTELTTSLAGFARRLARVLPGADLHVITYGASVEVSNQSSPLWWSRHFADLEPQNVSGRAFSRSLCQAASQLESLPHSRRRILLYIGEGAGDPQEAANQAETCLASLANTGVPAYITGFSSVSWAGESGREAENVLKRLSRPIGFYQRISVPQDPSSAPDFDTAFGKWLNAATNALTIDHRIRSSPPFRTILTIWHKARPLQAVVTITATTRPPGQGWSRVAVAEIGILGFLLGATVVQLLRVVRILRNEPNHTARAR